MPNTHIYFEFFLPSKSWKNHLKKLLTLAEIPSFQKFSVSSPTAQMAGFMFQNVAYRATVYRTGPIIPTLQTKNRPVTFISTGLIIETLEYLFCTSRRIWYSFCQGFLCCANKSWVLQTQISVANQINVALENILVMTASIKIQ